MSYTSMTKAALIATLVQRDARIEAAIDAYKALKATIPVKAARKSPALVEANRFETKDEMLEHYGASIAHFVITRDGDAFVANKREWR